MIRRIAVRIRNRVSRWLEIDDEARYQVYLATIRGTKINNLTYWLELLLACGIATLGLALNSPAILIGAMLISPLMTPIMGTGLALATGDVFLGFRVFFNLTLSVFLTLAASTFFVFVLPFKESTPEILSRIQPTILDLTVALLSGLAGSIATLKSARGLTAALPGTAIAVALLPPLCVVGFGFGTNQLNPQWWSVAKGGGLLFAANLVAIILTSMAIFLVVGMGRKKVRQRVDEWQRDPKQITRLELWLSRKKIFGAMERIGTLQARVAIILVFFALIYFPLHEALSRVVAQVSERGRRQEWIQVINQEAQRRFRIKDRSDIEKIDVENSPQGLRTLVRVSTNRLFEPEDRQEFEAVVSKRLNLPVRLVLIQSPGFFGEEKGADWTRVLGTQTAPPKEVSVQERYVLLFDRIQTVVLELWPLPKKSLLDLKIHLEEKKEGMITPSLTLSYLGNNDLGEDAKNVFQAGLKQVLGIDPEIRWNWIPSQYGPFNLKAGRTILSQEGREKIIKVSQTLQEFPELEAEIQFTSPPLPRRKRRQTPLPDYSLKIAAELEEQGLTSSQFVLTELEQETPQLLLSLKPRSNSQNSEENNLKAPIPTPTTPPIQAAETLPESQPEGGPDK